MLHSWHRMRFGIPSVFCIRRSSLFPFGWLLFSFPILATGASFAGIAPARQWV